jgi:hypothetical protein
MENNFLRQIVSCCFSGCLGKNFVHLCPIFPYILEEVDPLINGLYIGIL